MLVLNTSANPQGSSINGNRLGKSRWQLQMPNGTSETGSNVGGDFAIYRYADDGSFLSTALTINRNNGNAIFNASVNVQGTIYTTGEVQTQTAAGNGFRIVNGNYGVFQHTDTSTWYFMKTNSGDPWGSWSNTFPFWIDLATSNVSFGATVAINGGLTVSGGRIISKSGGGPTLAVYETGTGYASCILQSSGTVYIGQADGNGGYVTWYQYWNQSDRSSTFATNVTINGWLSVASSITGNYGMTLQGNSYGIMYRSGYGATNNTILLGWNNVVGGCATIGIDNGGACYGLANASDARMKYNIADSTFDCLAGVMGLKVREFDWITFNDPWKLREDRVRAEAKGRGEEIQNRFGLVAQEVAETLPDGVHAGDTFDDHLGVVWNLDSNTMIALLVGAVQQLSARVDALEAGR
jgi:hypothetical protein